VLRASDGGASADACCVERCVCGGYLFCRGGWKYGRAVTFWEVVGVLERGEKGRERDLSCRFYTCWPFVEEVGWSEEWEITLVKDSATSDPNRRAGLLAYQAPAIPRIV
jgi:hypothetical protein